MTHPPLQPCYIIAEAGVNHNGSLDLALQLVEAASDAGADAVKFQTFKADALVTKTTSKAEYQTANTGNSESQHSMLSELELSAADHDVLIDHCQKKNITFLSTGFDTESLKLLQSLDLPRYKIPSGEITNLPLLRQLASFGKPLIVSTGMATLEEIAETLAALEAAGVQRCDITLLHCTTQYPTPMENVNLRAMLSMGEQFKGVEIGYSDHTLGIEVPIAAAALGAIVIEKHFTLDRAMPGPDHAASLEPDELKAMVTAIQNIQRALGDGRKQPSAAELATRKVARKSIVAAKAISAGETLTEDNLTVKRAEGGISPMLWDTVLGTLSNQSYCEDQPIHV